MSQAEAMDQDEEQQQQSVPKLTPNFISRIVEASPDSELWTSGPVLQFLTVKKLNNPSTKITTDRFRIIVSDGERFMQGMLATQLNYMAQEEQIGKYTIARLDKFSSNILQNHRVLIILGLTVIGHHEEKIGLPYSIETAVDPNQGADNQAANAPVTGHQPPVQNSPQPVQASTSSIRPSGQTTTGQRLVFPIESLSPYQNKWTIKARVTQKSDVRQWSNNKGEGKLFNVTLMDESGEIRATGFNSAVDDLYDKLQEGKVYYISKARVNLAKKKFSNIQNEYELSFERGTEVEECLDQTNLPTLKYNFTPLSKLEECVKDSTADVIGVVKDVSPLSEIVSKNTSRPIVKRELNLVDRSNFSVRLTLWGKQAEQYDAEDQPVVAFKGVKVGDFGGRSLSMVSSSIMTVNPDIPDAHGLRGWYDALGHDGQFQSHTSGVIGGGSGGATFNRNEVRTIGEVKDAQLGEQDRVDFFSARATIVHIKTDNISYPACPAEGCNKKVIEGSEGWRCEKCDLAFSQPEHRYIMQMSVADHTSSAWLQGFNDVGLAVFGMPANDLVKLKEENEMAFNSVCHNATCQSYNFSCRAKTDTYNEQSRVRYGIQKILPLKYKEEAGILADLLHTEWAR